MAQVKTRTTGNVIPLPDGKFCWICSLAVEGTNETIEINSASGASPLKYETHELALQGLKDCAKVILKELYKRYGVKNVIDYRNEGKYKI